MTQCEKYYKLMNVKLDGDISFEDEKLLNKHLEKCENCRTVFNMMSAATQVDISADVPAGFSAAIMDSIKASSSQPVQEIYSKPLPKSAKTWRRSKFVKYGGLAACLIVVIMAVPIIKYASNHHLKNEARSADIADTSASGSLQDSDYNNSPNLSSGSADAGDSSSLADGDNSLLDSQGSCKTESSSPCSSGSSTVSCSGDSTPHDFDNSGSDETNSNGNTSNGNAPDDGASNNGYPADDDNSGSSSDDSDDSSTPDDGIDRPSGDCPSGGWASGSTPGDMIVADFNGQDIYSSDVYAVIYITGALPSCIDSSSFERDGGVYVTVSAAIYLIDLGYEYISCNAQADVALVLPG